MDTKFDKELFFLVSHWLKHWCDYGKILYINLPSRYMSKNCNRILISVDSGFHLQGRWDYSAFTNFYRSFYWPVSAWKLICSNNWGPRPQSGFSKSDSVWSSFHEAAAPAPAPACLAGSISTIHHQVSLPCLKWYPKGRSWSLSCHTPLKTKAVWKKNYCLYPLSNPQHFLSYYTCILKYMYDMWLCCYL